MGTTGAKGEEDAENRCAIGMCEQNLHKQHLRKTAVIDKKTLAITKTNSRITVWLQR